MSDFLTRILMRHRSIAFLAVLLASPAYSGAPTPDPKYPVIVGAKVAPLPADTFGECGGGQADPYAVGLSTAKARTDIEADIRAQAATKGFKCLAGFNQCSGTDFDLMWGITGGQQTPGISTEKLYIICFSKLVGE